MYCIAVVANVAWHILCSPDEGGTFCALGAVTVCGVLNLISSCCTCPAHLQGKHKVLAKNLNFKDKSSWMPYKFCCCEFRGIWVVVSPALQVTLSGLKKKCRIIGLCDKCGVQIFITIPVRVCARGLCMHAFIHMFGKKPQIDQRLYTSTVTVGRIHFDIFF